MSRIVFLLEERSMKVLLEGLLPRVLPSVAFQCIVHDGKNDLERSIPRKLRAWREPGVRFVVVRDNDSADCRQVKRRLEALCAEGRRADTLIRLACQELEAWYLGEPEALAEAYDRPDLLGLNDRAKFRDPDALQRPSVELARLIPELQKNLGARLLGRLLTRERNRSASFHALLDGIGRLVAGPGQASHAR